jgi:hypothetical protein
VVDIINSKYIPIKVFKGRSSITVALHWSKSITWRWLVKWEAGNYPRRISKFDNPSNGHGWRHISMGKLGIIRATWQPNMARK